MKTKNIRWIMWVLAMAMTTGISAQKTVLKAFDKMKDSKGVVVKKIIGATSPEPGKWRSNVVEFQIPKMEDAIVPSCFIIPSPLTPNPATIPTFSSFFSISFATYFNILPK